MLGDQTIKVIHEDGLCIGIEDGNGSGDDSKEQVLY
jgi:hypothetical protein